MRNAQNKKTTRGRKPTNKATPNVPATADYASQQWSPSGIEDAGLQLARLRADQIATEAEGMIVCPACDAPVSADGCHSCPWCNRTLHGICGEAAPDADEGHGQPRLCLTEDCIRLRPATVPAPAPPPAPTTEPAAKRRRGQKK